MQNEPMVSFKAGKLNKSGTTITADPRKGIVKMEMIGGLLHFKWETRPNLLQEND